MPSGMGRAGLFLGALRLAAAPRPCKTRYSGKSKRRKKNFPQAPGGDGDDGDTKYQANDVSLSQYLAFGEALGQSPEEVLNIAMQRGTAGAALAKLGPSSVHGRPRIRKLVQM
jgi:hypothetical protein